MSVDHYKPEIWSAVLQGSLEKDLVFGSDYVINRQYEGEISQLGDTVHISSIADPVISNYTPNAPLTYQTNQDAGQSFVVDQAKSWSVRIDDVDKKQAAGNFQSFFEDKAAYKMSDVMDQFIASLYTAAAPANILGTSGAPLTPGLYTTSAPADFYLKVILPLKVLLGQANVPNDGGRYLVLPPWAMALATQTQAFIAFPSTTGAPGEVMANGAVGRLGGFVLLESNNAVQTVAGGPGTGVWAIQCGHNSAVTFADQIVENEALRATDTFGDLVRGLHVYGAKVIRPEAIGVAYVLRPTGI